MPGYLNMENYVQFTDLQHSLLLHVLTIGYAAHFAAILYFVLTRHRTSPRYQASSIMSVVVMVSAGLLLFRLAQSFDAAFVWNGELWVLGESTYSHGYRYLNWLIDVPLLLIQILFVFNLTPQRVWSLRLQFGIAGVAMVVLGYVGQFYEATALAPLLLWGAASTVPYVYFSVILWRLIGESEDYLPGEAARTMRNIKLLFLFSWGLYPIAYLVPAVQLALGEVTADGAILRTFLFTVADVLSKIFYGVMVGKVLQIRSAAEGWEPALSEYPQIADPAELEPVGAKG